MNSKKEILLSVCISVHNTSEFLPRCMNSLLKQSLENFEIILVDNGSTDDSYKIMKKFQVENPQKAIVVFQQKDMGLAQGRQSGVNLAKGKYIAFLDADDWLYENALQRAIDIAIQEEVDIVEYETLRKGNVLSSNFEGKWACKDILKHYFEGTNLYSMLWLRIYRRELFEENVFPDIYVNNEDMYALPCLLYKAETMYFLKECLHVYADDNEMAVMHRINNNIEAEEKVFENKVKLLKSVLFVKNFIGQEVIKEEFEYEFAAYEKRNIVTFCTHPFKNYSVNEKIKMICDCWNIDITMFYKRMKKSVISNKIFSMLEKLMGFKGACIIYERLYPLRSGGRV